MMKNNTGQVMFVHDVQGLLEDVANRICQEYGIGKMRDKTPVEEMKATEAQKKPGLLARLFGRGSR